MRRVPRSFDRIETMGVGPKAGGKPGRENSIHRSDRNLGNARLRSKAGKDKDEMGKVQKTKS